MRNILIVLLLLPLLAYPQYDKYDPHGYGLHFVAGTLISGGTTLIINEITHRPILSSMIGDGVACLAGGLKEWVWDGMLHHGYPNIKDAGYTALGALSFSLVFDLATIIKHYGTQ